VRSHLPDLRQVDLDQRVALLRRQRKAIGKRRRTAGRVDQLAHTGARYLNGPLGFSVDPVEGSASRRSNARLLFHSRLEIDRFFVGPQDQEPIIGGHPYGLCPRTCPICRAPQFGKHAALIHAQAFAAYLAPLHNSEWVVYSKRPFGGPAGGASGSGGPLGERNGRYLHGLYAQATQRLLRATRVLMRDARKLARSRR
jgi:hypothetical protein